VDLVVGAVEGKGVGRPATYEGVCVGEVVGAGVGEADGRRVGEPAE